MEMPLERKEPQSHTRVDHPIIHHEHGEWMARRFDCSSILIAYNEELESFDQSDL